MGQRDCRARQHRAPALVRLSFMPEGLEKQIDMQAMAELLAYLNSIK
jgi:hypothetical protein